MLKSARTRLYDRLAMIFPAVQAPVEGASYFVPPPIDGDLASYCAVCRVTASSFELELSHDTRTGSAFRAAPYMLFRVQRFERSAELLALHDETRSVATVTSHDARQQARMNVHGINWLTIMLNLGGAFREIGEAAARPAARHEEAR